MQYESAFSIEASRIKFGPGVTSEVGYDMSQLGASHVLVLTDPNLATREPVSITLDALSSAGIDTVLFDQVRIEPTDASFKNAIQFASSEQFDGFVAVGGGSTIDTAKVVNLYTTYPAEFLAYVNLPIGENRLVPGPLRPLIAIPTTAGTGSETTGIAIFDFLELHAKTGIAHNSLRPSLGLIDPHNTRTLPKMVATCTAMDILCHAIESLTALPYHQRPAPAHPGLRPTYQGSNPISDIWVSQAIEMVTQNLLQVIDDPSDISARSQLLLAATFSGIGFGNSGVHLPHGMSYPVSGMVRDYIPDGYPSDNPLIPHGMAVILTAPAVFQFTASINPTRHLQAAKLLGVDISSAHPPDAGPLLSDALLTLMQQTGIPNGLHAVGFTPDDVDQLVHGTLPQHRVTKLSPRPATAPDLKQLFLNSMTLW